MSAEPDVQIECDTSEARALAGAGAVMLDVRRHDELEIASIDGAVHVPLDQIADRVDEIRALNDGGCGIVVFCHHGVRSMRATEFLRAHGLRGVRSMAGGIDRWSLEIDAGVPRY